MRLRYLLAGAVLVSAVMCAAAGARAQTPGVVARPLELTAEQIDGYEARLASLRAASSSCTVSNEERLMGEVVVWALSQRANLALDAEEGREALTACRLDTAAAVVRDLSESRDQLLQMALTFGQLSASKPSPASAESPLADAEWVARLDAQRGRADQLAAADPLVVRLNALIDTARPLAEVAMACRLQRNPLGVAERIGDFALYASTEAASLERLSAQAAAGCARASASTPALAAPPIADTGVTPPAIDSLPLTDVGKRDAARDPNSWLPPAAGATGADRSAPVPAMPAWIPLGDAPTQTSPVRASELVDRARDALVQEEQQRMVDADRARAEAKQAAAERAALQARDAELQARERQQQQAQAAAQTQALAAQRATASAQRRSNFAGLLGRVTSVVGARVGLPSSVTALMPTLTSIASGDMSVQTLAQLPGAIAGVPANVQGIARDVATVLQPQAGVPATTTGTKSDIANLTNLLGGARQAAGALGDPFSGAWSCKLNRMATGSSQGPTSVDLQLQISASGAGYALRLPTGELRGNVTDDWLLFQTSLPGNGVTCQMDVRLQPRQGTLAGTERVSCTNGQRLESTVQCQR